MGGGASCAEKRFVEKVLMWASVTEFHIKDTEVLELTRSNDLENSWSWKIKYSEIFFNISVSIILGIVSYKIDNFSYSCSGMFCWVTALNVLLRTSLEFHCIS